MLSIVTHRVAWSVGLSVTLHVLQTAEPTEMPFGLWVRTSPRNHELDGVRIPREKGQFRGKG